MDTKNVLTSKKGQSQLLGILAALGTSYADQPWWVVATVGAIAIVYIASQAYVDRAVYVAQIEKVLDAAKRGVDLGRSVEAAEDE